MKCNVCGKEVKPEEGLDFWNMVTGFQATVHKGACEEMYKKMCTWCRMGLHSACVLHCKCHKEGQKRG